MRQPPRALLQVQALSPAVLLRALVLHRAAAEALLDGDAPQVTVFVDGGQSWSGCPLRLDGPLEGPGVLLLACQEGRGGPWVLVSLRVESVIGVQLHDAEALAELLLGDPPLRAPGETLEVRPPSTRAMERRAIEEAAKGLARGLSLSVDWGSVPAEGEPMQALSGLVSRLTEALAELASDPFAGADLSGLHEIAIEGGGHGILRDGAVLRVSADLSRGDAGLPDQGALVEAMRRLL